MRGIEVWLYKLERYLCCFVSMFYIQWYLAYNCVRSLSLNFSDQYVGCYEDKKERIMESKMFVDKKNTIGNCIRRCKQMGRKYAGMEVKCRIDSGY